MEVLTRQSTTVEETSQLQVFWTKGLKRPMRIILQLLLTYFHIDTPERSSQLQIFNKFSDCFLKCCWINPQPSPLTGSE